MDPKTHLIDFWKQKLRLNEKEIQAFESLDRSLFVPEPYRMQAYDDTPLPILCEKTISQPTTVMMMTAALDIQEEDHVFEVGTGSGYQAAIIAKIARKGYVVSAEVKPELIAFARENLKNVGVPNVEIIEEEGSNGYPAKAPYDKIIITAACKEFPKKLLEQLKPEGIIIAPVGSEAEQEMVKGIKEKDGKLSLEFLGQFVFSSMYGKYGFED